MNSPSPSRAAGVILLHTGPPVAEHERGVHRHLAQDIAEVLGIPMLGIREAGDPAPQPGSYLIPDATLVGPQSAVRSPADLYGGVVSHPFMAGKTISHPLIDTHAVAPVGWTEEFIRVAGTAVLPGFSAFDRSDALRAGQQLMKQGPVRAKRVCGRAGRGQQTVQTERELQRWLDSLEDEDIHLHGVVLEQNLEQVRTYSVGQLQVGAYLISYFGQQRLTIANDGAAVYGGSDLYLVRGNYLALQQQFSAALPREAINKAQRYEQAAEAAFPGFIASRRNCDVAMGVSSSGQRSVGVLEQSWRIGGASSAEIQALRAFAADPRLQRIRASSWEIYGDSPTIPDHSRILFRGDDPDTGPLTKGVTLRPWQPPANP